MVVDAFPQSLEMSSNVNSSSNLRCHDAEIQALRWALGSHFELRMSMRTLFQMTIWKDPPDPPSSFKSIFKPTSNSFHTPRGLLELILILFNPILFSYSMYLLAHNQGNISRVLLLANCGSVKWIPISLCELLGSFGP
jgi:hypothetical protein